MNIPLPKIVLLAALCLIALAGAAAASDARMAGAPPGLHAEKPAEEASDKAPDKAKAEEKAPESPVQQESGAKKEKAADSAPAKEETNSKAETKPETPADAAGKAIPDTPVSPDTPHFRTDYSKLEALGTLTTPQEGSLGVDIWDGSERPMIEWLVAHIPPQTQYRVINNLVRQALLTSADTDMLSKQGSIEPGQDLLTLRLEKLIEMGAFGEAEQLYALNPDDPYHERLGRAGILAMLYNGQTALGCLETKALQKRFGSDPYWRQLTAVCDYVMARMGGDEQTITKAVAASESSGLTSDLIKKAIRDNSFRYNFKSVAEFEKLDALERVFLVASDRIDYSGLKKLNISELSPYMASLLRHDRNVPSSLRFKLWKQAVRIGTRSTEDLAAFYKSVPFAKNLAYGSVQDWQRLAWLYQAADVIKTGTINEPIQKALALAPEYGVYSLLPFAAQLKKTTASAFDPESIRIGLEILTLTGEPIPADWAEKWQNIKTDSRRDFLLQTAYIVSRDLSTAISPNLSSIQAQIDKFPKAKAQLLRYIYARLDRSGKIIEDPALGTYEKQLDLTSSSDYVMPSMGLKESFFAARDDRRVAEVILLSSLVLHGTPPDSIYPELLRETVKGLDTVGLTKNTRELTVEVVLGLE